MYKIYLLEDEKWLLESLFTLINWNKYYSTVIGKSTNSLEAYKEIQYRQPDIVFTDIRMPEMNGIELMEKLNQENCKSVFVVITGHAEFDYVQKALENRAVSYCLKPYNEEEIIEALLKAQKACKNKQVLNALKKGNKQKENIKSNQTFKMIYDFIDSHFTEEITLQQIADKFFLNASYLSNLFKKELEMTYSSYLTGLRINYACKLLSKTQLSVNEIADTCGFHNYYYFARIFKKHKQLTPSQFREKEINR